MDGHPDEELFPQALAGLKRRGSSLLVVGGAAGDGQLAACGRLLGSTAADRERLLVCTGEGDHLDERVEAVEARSVHVLDAGNCTRSTATRTGAPVPPSTADVPDGDLDALRAATVAEIESRGDLESGRLRVCVDTLAPLLEAHGRADVTGFLQSVTSEVGDASGIGHVHLPVDRDDAVVQTLAPLFDAVLEVRTEGGEHSHRWHLRDPELTTDWLAL